jgi:O-antigen/teichoic acid export membrane protein
MVSVAVFSRANGLVQIFRQLVLAAVMPVCLPYFSKAVREEGSVVRGYVVGMSYFSAIGWPFLGFMALAAFPAIRIVYGDQWTEAVPLARILCLAGALDVVHCLANEALLSQGQVRLSIRLQLMLQAAFVTGLLAAVPFGLLGACLGVLAASLLGLLLAQWHLHQGTGLSLAHTWQGCRGSLLVSTITLAPLLVSLAWVRADEHNFVRYIAVGGTVTALMWLTALRLSHHPLWAELCRLAKAVAGRLRAPPPV